MRIVLPSSVKRVQRITEGWQNHAWLEPGITCRSDTKDNLKSGLVYNHLNHISNTTVHNNGFENVNRWLFLWK